MSLVWLVFRRRSWYQGSQHRSETQGLLSQDRGASPRDVPPLGDLVDIKHVNLDIDEFEEDRDSEDDESNDENKGALSYARSVYYWFV